MTSVPDERVDRLRTQLRALGYLDAGVDRFVLGPAQDRRGPAGLALRLALRVGLIGGVLLGPAAAIGVGARLPGLISGVRDAAVIAVYLGIVFWLATTALSFVVMLATVAFARVGEGRFDRRGPRAARVAAWITTIATLLYLTLWWRNASAGFGWNAPLWTASALCLAVAISLLLGHAQRTATLAVLVSAAGPASALPAVTPRSWRVVAGGAAVAFAGAALLLILAAPAETPPAQPSLTVVPTGVRLRVIAIDGFDLQTFLSHFVARTRLSDALHSPTQLQMHDTADPARAWTTIATGAPPEVHGVHGIEARRVAGIRGLLPQRDSGFARLVADATDLVRLTRPSLTSGEARKVKTIWEVAEDAGLRTAVINWWATWPAAGAGIVISDRAMVRLEKGGPLDAEIAPAALYAPLRERWPEIRRRAQDEAAAAFPDVKDPAVLAALRRSAEIDLSVVALLHALPGPARDLDLIYLPGLDIAQHAILSRDGATAPSTSEVAARVAGIGRYYEFLQALVEPLIQAEGNEMTLVLTQPGRVATPLAGYVAMLDRESTLVQPTRSEDAIATGRRSRAGGVGTPLEVLPTIAYALGLPLSRELNGRPLMNLFGSAFAQTRPREVPTYGRPSTGERRTQGQPLDQETIDRLRSLGYIK